MVRSPCTHPVHLVEPSPRGPTYTTAWTCPTCRAVVTLTIAAGSDASKLAALLAR